MPSFALITEGITDQAILESVLVGKYGDDLDINPLQPARDTTDENRQGAFGGFEGVIEYCSLEQFEDALLFNDFVVIQLDTDVCEHGSIGIPLSPNGESKPTDDLVLEVRNFLTSRIRSDIFSVHGNRIIFAIAVHSCECWLIPLHCGPGRGRTNSCEAHLARELRKTGRFSKDYRTYEELARGLRKKRTLLKVKQDSRSLEIFLDSLPPNTSE
jgi:hypothetical protein